MKVAEFVQRGRSWSGYALGVHWIILAYCLFAPLSIAVAEITLNVLVVWWLLLTASDEYSLRRGKYAAEQVSNSHLREILTCGPVRAIAVATVLFFFSCFASSFGGIRFWKSLTEVGKLALSLLLPLAVCQALVMANLSVSQLIDRLRLYVATCLVGFSFVLLFTVLVSWFGEPPAGVVRPPGPVTGSGQLALVLPAALGFLAVPRALCRKRHGLCFHRTALFKLAISTLGFVACAAVAVWPGIVGAHGWRSLPILLAGAGIALGVMVAFIRLKKFSVMARSGRWGFMLLVGASVALFLVNLKRGPWIGAGVAVAVLGTAVSRRLVVAGLALAMVCAVALPPVRARVGQFYDDFVIAGGRQQMWTLATDLIPRYPLGVGFRNSDYMRQLDPSLPQLHRHFHSNLINVTVELGILGLATYCIWLLTIFKEGFTYTCRRSSSICQLSLLARAFTASLLAWQVAGFFEYNLGDREVRYLALILLGFLLVTFVKRSQLINRSNRSG